MDLDRMRRLIGPPPRQAPPVDWTTVHEALGLRLPTDFVAFASAYGPIVLGEFVTLWSPTGAAARYDDGTYRWLRSLRDVDPTSHPYDYHETISDFALEDLPAYPRPGGLLYCGGNENRDTVWWDTTDPDPDAWSMVIERGSAFTPFRGTLTVLLIQTLTGRPPRLTTGTVSAPPRRGR